jgi:hypothetical protein
MHPPEYREPDPSRIQLNLQPLDLPPLAALPEPLKEPARRVLGEAESVLIHKMKFVSPKTHDYGDPISWTSDPLTGYEWPRSWFGSVDFGRPDMGRDAIRVWELSRGHQLLTLARGARLAPDRAGAYITELVAQLDDWSVRNPVGYSVNWGNAMEAAIRAVNWIWAIRTAPSKLLSADFVTRVTRSLQEHGAFIRSNLEGTPWRRGNHYIADIMGLAVLGACLEGEPRAGEWTGLAGRLLEGETMRQIYADGLSFESSSCYQGLVLEMASIAIDSLDRAGEGVSGDARDRIAAMIGASVAIRHPDGRTAQFGDSDSGRVLPGGFSREPNLDPVIWTAAALLGKCRPLAGDPDPEVAWSLGLDRWNEMARSQSKPQEPPASFPHGGIEVLDGPGGKVVVNRTPVGQDGNGGHAHSDALSFEWSVAGHTVVVDPGTYCYTASSADRNLMRSTAVHPTPMIDGQEINPIDPKRTFFLYDTGRPKVIERSEKDSKVNLRVSHPGFERLADPVSVTRQFELDRGTGDLTINDHLEGSGTHDWSVPVPIAPDWEVELESNAHARATGPGGTVTFEFEGPGFLTLEEYWYSSGYGIRERADRLVFVGHGRLPRSIVMKARPD